MTVPEGRQFKKSTYSDNSATCVEVRQDLAAVRDSKKPDAGDLPVSPTAFAVFTRAIGAGRFTPTA